VKSIPEPPWAEPFGDVPDPWSVEKAPLPYARLATRLPSPERAVMQKRRVAALSGSLLWLGAQLAVFGMRRDLAELPFVYVAAQVLLPVGLAVSTLVLALQPGKLGLGMRLGPLSTFAVLAPAAFALAAAGTPLPTEPRAGAVSPLGMGVCFGLSVAWASIPLLLLALSLRGAFAAAARWRSALVGAGAGLFAGATINLHCPNLAPLHLLLGHGLPVLIATLAGACLLARGTEA
jgi:hypothetical protein